MPPLVTIARRTGAAYLGLALTGAAGHLVLTGQLVVPHDPAATLAHLQESPLLAQLALVLELLVVLTQALAAWGFFALFRRDHIVAAFAFELGKVSDEEIQDRTLANLLGVDDDLCRQVAAHLGRPVSDHVPADAGEVLDSSRGREPLSYLHGAGNIVPGLEEAMEGKRAGDAFKVDVAPEDGYGIHHDGLVQDVPRGAFQGVDTIEPGMSFQASTPQGVHSVTVTKVTADTITVDGNHPLAGQTLHFDVEVTEVRAV